MLSILAVRVVPQKPVEEVETHVKRFAVDGVGTSLVHKVFGRGLNDLHQGTLKNGCL